MKTLAFLSGIVFGIGLLVSGMTDPAKVIAFLDIAGPWDPSLILVMITAVLVAAAAAAAWAATSDSSAGRQITNSPWRPRAASADSITARLAPTSKAPDAALTTNSSGDVGSSDGADIAAACALIVLTLATIIRNAAGRRSHWPCPGFSCRNHLGDRRRSTIETELGARQKFPSRGHWRCGA